MNRFALFVYSTRGIDELPGHPTLTDLSAKVVLRSAVDRLACHVRRASSCFPSGSIVRATRRLFPSRTPQSNSAAQLGICGLLTGIIEVVIAFGNNVGHLMTATDS